MRLTLFDIRRWPPVVSPHPGSERAYFARGIVMDRTLPGHTGCVNSIEFNDTGTLLLTGSDDTHVCLYDTSSWKRLATLQTSHVRNIFNAVMVPKSNDRLLITCGLDGRVCLAKPREGDTDLVDTEVPRRTVLTHRPALCSRIAFTGADPQTAYITQATGEILVVDVRSERVVDTFSPAGRGEDKSINCIAPSSVHPHILACGTDQPFVSLVDRRYLRRTDSAFLQLMTPDAARSSGIGGISFSNRGDKIVCSYKSNDVYAYRWTSALHSADRKMTDRTEVARYTPKRAAANNLVMCPADRFAGRSNRLTMFKEAVFFNDDRFVVSGGDCGHVFVWDAETTRLLHKVKADSDIVNGVLTHPALHVIVACGIDDEAKVLAPNPVTRDKGGSPCRFMEPQMRRRFAGGGYDEQELEGDSADPTDTDDDPSDGWSSEDEWSDDSNLERQVARAEHVAQLQIGTLRGWNDSTDPRRLVEHGKLIHTMLCDAEHSYDASIHRGSAVLEDEDEHDDGGDPTTRHSDASAQEASSASMEDDDVVVRSEEEDDVEVSSAIAVDPPTSESDSVVSTTDSSDADSNADDEEEEDTLTTLLALLHPYVGILEQVRTQCTRKRLLPRSDAALELGAPPRRSDTTLQFWWGVYSTFAGLCRTALNLKACLAMSREALEAWSTMFVTTTVDWATIVAIEGDANAAVSCLATGESQLPHPSLRVRTLMVAVLHASKRAAPGGDAGDGSLLDQARKSLEEALQLPRRRVIGSREDRTRALRMLQTLEESADDAAGHSASFSSSST